MSTTICSRCKQTFNDWPDPNCPHCPPQLAASEISAQTQNPQALREQKQLAVLGGISLVVVLFFCVCSGLLNQSGSTSKSESLQPSQATSSPRLNIGSDYSMSVTCFGGVTESDLERGHNLVETGDRAALNQMLTSGQLIHIPMGASVTVESVTLMGKARVRMRGNPNPVWVFSVWVRN